MSTAVTLPDAADRGGEPFRDAAVAAAELQALPALADPERGEVSPCPRIQNLRHQVEPLVLDG